MKFLIILRKDIIHIKFKNNYCIRKVLKGMMGFRSRKIRNKLLLKFFLRKVIHSLFILLAIMTICFLVLYSQRIIDIDFILFYLYFSAILFIVYSFLIIGIYFLEQPLIEKIAVEPTEIVEEIDDSKPIIIEDLLQGKTLQVYWFFFVKKHVGVREIQKLSSISSSGTVSYQLNKLLKAGIISKDEEEGKYSLKKVVKIGIFKFFIRIGNRAIPRISLYLIIYLSGFIIYLILALIQGISFFLDPINLLMLFFLILGTTVFVLESYKIWKLIPIRSVKKNREKKEV